MVLSLRFSMVDLHLVTSFQICQLFIRVIQRRNKFMACQETQQKVSSPPQSGIINAAGTTIPCSITAYHKRINEPTKILTSVHQTQHKYSQCIVD
jgi:hypothetical protein